MTLDHVTFHVPDGTLEREDLSEFFDMIGFTEIEARDQYEHGWKVRWFTFAPDYPPRATTLHLVEGEREGYLIEFDVLVLGHFCIKAPSIHDLELWREAARLRGWLERASGSGRIWLKYANLRVEVRP